MKIKIPYWGEELEISIPKQNVGEIIYPNRVEIQSEKKILLEAINNPVESQSFDDFIKGNDAILFIVNDATRPTPTARIISLIWEKIKNKDVKFMVATGMHRAPSEDEYLEIFGEYYEKIKGKIFSHNARNEKENMLIGRTKNGTDVYFDKMVMKTKKIAFITSVEPHYFAGYTGGAKSFLPGISGYKTITHNHEMALKFTAKALVTKGNPVREDIEEAFDFIAKDKKIFSIQTVLNRNHKVYYCVCGETHQAFELACKKAKDVFSVEIKDRADIVVAVAPYPMDINLYQSQKAIDNSKSALNDNGILILISSCRKGIGDETFTRLLSEAKDPDQALERIAKGYKFGYHKASKMAEIMKWASIWSFTKLKPNLLNDIFIRGFLNLQEALNEAIKKKGNEKILFLMNASMTVPRIAPHILHKHRFIHGPKPKITRKEYFNTDDLFSYDKNNLDTKNIDSSFLKN
ncbi:MAG: nickel-dependent lactate racemase [Candidatus Marinimicrobia bacterium]|nr:nickel-dependent lactate racemase [Candidatus Neomarinimicrobiota bacterium]